MNGIFKNIQKIYENDYNKEKFIERLNSLKIDFISIIDDCEQKLEKINDNDDNNKFLDKIDEKYFIALTNMIRTFKDEIFDLN